MKLEEYKQKIGEEINVYTQAGTFRGQLAKIDDGSIILNNYVNFTEAIDSLYKQNNSNGLISKIVGTNWDEFNREFENPLSILRRNNQIKIDLEKIIGIGRKLK